MENRASSSQKEASSQKKKKSCKKKNKSKIVESKNLDQSAHHGGNQRRINVFAEQYNPEEDTTDEKDLPVFPKTTEERKMLKKAFGSIVLFKNLSEDQMEQVLNSMEKKEVQAGDIVIRQGDNGDYFYVIMTGLYDVTTTKPNGKTEKINTFDNGGSFGELALLYNQPRAATVTAVTDGILWAMSRVTFRTIVLKSAYKKRKQYEEFLSKVEILDVLTPYDRSNLCDALTTITYEDGKVIFKEGESANGMYFVEKGQVSISNEKKGELGILNVGDYFGELALITKKPRAATVTAVGHVNVAFLDIEAFERLLGPCMEVLEKHIKAYRKSQMEAK